MTQSGLDTAKAYIQDLNLSPHPEGGFFVLTYVEPTQIPSPFAKNKEERPVCSVIYYLLAPEDAKAALPGDAKLPKKHRTFAGYFHTNHSTTSHTWHSGKAVYTLIKREKPADGGLPETKTVVLGSDASKGEQMQWIVPPGWWKRSELVDRDDGHCLITETVSPGWHPDEHEFMNEKHLKELFGERQDLLASYSGDVLEEGHALEF